MEGFDWAFNAKGVDRRSIEQLMTCDFVRRHENVILGDPIAPTAPAPSWKPVEPSEPEDHSDADPVHRRR